MASGLFRVMASLGRNMILAMNFGGFAVLILFALGGFVLARGRMTNLNDYSCYYYIICKVTNSSKTFLHSVDFS